MRPLLPLAFAFASLTAACGGAPSHPMQAPSAQASPAPVLTASVYGKDPSGSIGEDGLQLSLKSAIDLQFPARLGIVPLAAPFDPKAKGKLRLRHVAAGGLGPALLASPHFTQINDVDTELPNVGGIEGLRVLASRYRLRYLLLYSERFEDSTHLNGWAWTYATVVGMFIVPGVTVSSHGVLQADLLDVRTGTILFTVVESVSVDEKTFMIGAGRSHLDAQAKAAVAAAPALAKKVMAQTQALVDLAEGAEQNKPKPLLLPPPVQN